MVSIAYIVAIVCAVLFVLATTGRLGKRKDMLMLLFGGIAVGGLLVGTGVLPWMKELKVLPDEIVAPSAVKDGLPIKTLQVRLVEFKSSSYSAVNGQLEFYEVGVDPNSPTATPLFNGTVTSGVASHDNPRLFTGKYRVIFVDESDSSPTWYSEDFGIQNLAGSRYEKEQGLYLFANSLTNHPIVKIATLSTVVNETAIDGSINGETSFGNLSDTSGEIGCDSVITACTKLTVDESNSDATYYVDFKIGAEGGNKDLRDAVLCFVHDATHPPEGNEFDAIDVSRQSGAELPELEGRIEDFFAVEGCVNLGDIPGGTSSTERITFTMSEVSTDTNDDFKICVDDLADYKGKSIGLQSGASSDCTSFDARA